MIFFYFLWNFLLAPPQIVLGFLVSTCQILEELKEKERGKPNQTISIVLYKAYEPPLNV